jgi:hypothetical protein
MLIDIPRFVRPSDIAAECSSALSILHIDADTTAFKVAMSKPMPSIPKHVPRFLIIVMLGASAPKQGTRIQASQGCRPQITAAV